MLYVYDNLLKALIVTTLGFAYFIYTSTFVITKVFIIPLTSLFKFLSLAALKPTKSAGSLKFKKRSEEKNGVKREVSLSRFSKQAWKLACYRKPNNNRC